MQVATKREPLGAKSAMREGFRQLMLGVAATEQVPLSTPALVLLLGWVDQADVAEDVSAEELLEVQLDLVRIVHAAAVEAQSRGDIEVSALSIKSVRRSLCPLPPWIRPPCEGKHPP